MSLVYYFCICIISDLKRGNNFFILLLKKLEEMNAIVFRTKENYDKLFIFRNPKYSMEPTFCIYKGDVYRVLNELEYRTSEEQFPTLTNVYDEEQKKISKSPTSILDDVMKGERYNYFPNKESKLRRFFVSRVTKKIGRVSMECGNLELDEMKLNTFYTVFDKRIREIKIPNGSIFIDVTTHLDQRCSITKNPKGYINDVKIYSPIVVNGSLYSIEYILIKNKVGIPQLFKIEYRFDCGKTFKKGLVPMNILGKKNDGLIFDWTVDVNTKTSNLIRLNHTIAFELIVPKKQKKEKSEGRPFYYVNQSSRCKQIVNEKSINGFKCLGIQVFNTTF